MKIELDWYSMVQYVVCANFKRYCKRSLIDPLDNTEIIISKIQNVT